MVTTKKLLNALIRNRTDIQDRSEYGRGLLLIKLALLTLAFLAILLISELIFYTTIKPVVVNLCALSIVCLVIHLVRRGNGYGGGLLFVGGLMIAIVIGSVVTIDEPRYSETENLFFGLFVMIIALFENRTKLVFYTSSLTLLVAIKYYRFLQKGIPLDENFVKLLIIVGVISLAINYCTTFFKSQLLRVLVSTNRLNRSLRKNEKELLEANDQLLRVNAEKNEVIGVVAHDLRSPLNAVAGILPLLKNDLYDILNEEQRFFCQTMQNSVERMRNMITKILDLNAIESQSKNLQAETCDVGKILTTVVDNHYLMAANKRIMILRDFRSDNHFIHVDPSYAAQIFDNLLSNAIKFSASGTVIKVSAYEEDDDICIVVRDQGPGISEQDQKQLFKRFSKLTAKPTGSETSTGLGLSIVKKYVDMMNGSIEVSSELDIGSTFTVRFKMMTTDCVA